MRLKCEQDWAIVKQYMMWIIVLHIFTHCLSTKTLLNLFTYTLRLRPCTLFTKMHSMSKVLGVHAR